MYFIFVHRPEREREQKWGESPERKNIFSLVSVSENLFDPREIRLHFPVGNLAIYIFVNACLFKKELIKGKHRS